MARHGSSPSAPSGSSADGVPLGPFDLLDQVGSGGMGEVWRAVHRAQQVEVAVKLLTERGCHRPSQRAAFRNEIRVIAGLDHPYIAAVLDHGEVSEEATRASGGRLVQGSPWLAMELARGGSLAPWRGRLSWLEIREVLRCLLDALAHAHARGVIHRDIKPGNVLLPEPGGRIQGVKLADFGVAHLFDAPERGGNEAPGGGTPDYMAPEQIDGDRGAMGPWTDLYGLGRLAEALLWGQPEPGPALRVAIPAPAGFESWVARLLQADPRERFACAADAAFALEGLGDQLFPDDAEMVQPLLGVRAVMASLGQARVVSAAWPGGAAHLPAPDLTSTVADPDPDTDRLTILPSNPDPPPRVTTSTTAEPTSRRAAPCPVRPAPMPGTWRRPQGPKPPMSLVGAGLGLYGLRAVPMAGRASERDRLWQALRRARDTERPQVVLLRGAAGVGKSRLAEWLSERAAEVGAANRLKVSHSWSHGPLDGLAPAIARGLRCWGQPRAEVRARVEQELHRHGISDADEMDALTELLCPMAEHGPDPSSPVIAFATPVERYMLVQRHLERAGQRRGVVLWLDDVQWGADALAFVVHLLERAGTARLPVLVLMTSVDEGLVGRAAEAGLLDTILAHEASQMIEVAPLEADAHRELVRGLLGLEGDLATRVEARTAGNPLFAVQLVGDWVTQGLLEPGPTGFRLQAGAQIELPDVLHQVWSARVEHMLRGRTAGDERALELAAALGQDVDIAEWRRVCQDGGLRLSPDLLDALLRERLARVDDPDARSWSFVHGMLRESVLRRAREQGRLADDHRLCAGMLRTRAGRALARLSGAGEPSRIDARLGRHLLAAGELSEALSPLRRATRAQLGNGEYREATLLLDEYFDALSALELPEGDARWGEGWVLRGRLARLLGRADTARAWVARAQAEATVHGWRAVSAEALWEQAPLLWAVGDPEAALRTLQAAETLAAELDDRALLGQCRVTLASMQRRVGRQADAAATYRVALTDCQAAQDSAGAAYCLLGLGGIALYEERLDEAREDFERAHDAFTRAGSRRGVADCLNALGELYRNLGDLDAAGTHYRASMARLNAIGSAQTVMPECNLGLVLVEQGRCEEARQVFESLLETFSTRGPRVYRGNVHAYLLPCTVGMGDLPAFDQHLERARALLQESGQIDPDIARMADIAGLRASDRNLWSRARACWELAQAQWRALGREDRAAAIEARLRAAHT